MNLKMMRFSAKLLCAFLFALLLAGGAFAATITKLDLVITLPSAGMTRQEYEDSLKLQAAVTEHGDLVAMGQVTEAWYGGVNGEFDRTDPSNQKYIGGNTYQLLIKPIFINSQYKLPHDAEYCVIPSQFTVTVNGIAAETAQYAGIAAPTVMFYYTVPAPQLSPQEQAAADAARKAEIDERHADLRKIIAKPYTVAEADALWVGANEQDALVLTGDIKELDWNNIFGEAPLKNPYFVTKVVFDVTSDDKSYDSYWGSRLVVSLPNLKELWVGEGVDAMTFYEGTMNEFGLGRAPISGSVGYQDLGVAFGEGNATLYLPSSQVSKAKAMEELPYHFPPFPFAIKLYDGDVNSAQKTGSAYEWCTNHSYRLELYARDRVYQYASCNNQGTLMYYSCEFCSKCEYNPNHTFVGRGPYNHRFYAFVASDEAYIGKDQYGNHVYWNSCMYCGKSQNVINANPTQEDWRLSGTEFTYEQYVASCQQSVKQHEEWALITKDSQIGMFVLADKSTANMNSWAQDGVNQALDNNLIDVALMGADYTQPISRLQFCSVAVKLAEELTGKSIAAAPANTFVDTDNAYVLKAYAAGITSGTSANTFSPYETLDRQQMATFIYRTLQYITKNSDIKYTPYDSKLSNFADNWQIADWAREPLAFMNALDLIKGTTDTTIAPTNKCTIEQALTVAARSIYADHIGWYQIKSPEENANFFAGDSNEKYWFGPRYGNDISLDNLIYNQRVWVTGRRIKGDYSYVTICDDYTGQVFFVKAEWFRPVR